MREVWVDQWGCAMKKGFLQHRKSTRGFTSSKLHGRPALVRKTRLPASTQVRYYIITLSISILISNPTERTSVSSHTTWRLGADSVCHVCIALYCSPLPLSASCCTSEAAPCEPPVHICISKVTQDQTSSRGAIDFGHQFALPCFWRLLSAPISLESASLITSICLCLVDVDHTALHRTDKVLFI